MNEKSLLIIDGDCGTKKEGVSAPTAEDASTNSEKVSKFLKETPAKTYGTIFGGGFFCTDTQ